MRNLRQFQARCRFSHATPDWLPDASQADQSRVLGLSLLLLSPGVRRRSVLNFRSWKKFPKISKHFQIKKRTPANVHALLGARPPGRCVATTWRRLRDKVRVRLGPSVFNVPAGCSVLSGSRLQFCAGGDWVCFLSANSLSRVWPRLLLPL